MPCDLFGGAYAAPAELRLVQRFSVRLSPRQKEKFMSLARSEGKVSSEVLRGYIVSLVGD